MRIDSIKLPNFKKNMQNRFKKFEFEVGILKDGPHKEAKTHHVWESPDLKTLYGGPASKISNKASENTVGEIFIQNQQRLGTDLLRDPFKKNKQDINRFANAYLKLIFGKIDNIRRVENLLQAIVRNPILRGDYGINRKTTAMNKGFNRHLIDTGQMFKAITAKARMKRV